MKKAEQITFLVISLTSAQKRRDTSTSQLSNVDFRFVDATDGRTDNSMGNRFVTNLIDAIWDSHKKAYREFLKLDFQYCLILEDDFEINSWDKLDTELDNLIRFKPDLAQIGWLNTGLDIRFQRIYESVIYRIARFLIKVRKLSPKLDQLVKSKMRLSRATKVPASAIPDSFLPGAHAYLISKEFAQNAITLNNPTFLSTDDFLMSIAKMRSFNAMRLRKSLIFQSGVTSVGRSRFIQI